MVFRKEDQKVPEPGSGGFSTTRRVNWIHFLGKIKFSHFGVFYPFFPNFMLSKKHAPNNDLPEFGKN